MTRNILTSSYWLTLRKEIHTSFKLAIGWMQCCGLSIWVLPAKVTNNRFLQTWWLLSKSLRKKRGELLLHSGSEALVDQRQRKPVLCQGSRASLFASGFWTEKALIPGNEVRHSQRNNCSCKTNCHGPRFLSLNWPVETTALKERKENQHQTPNSVCDLLAVLCLE